MQSTNPELAAVDAAYADALADFHAARLRLREAGAARVAAHLDEEYLRSKEAQDAAQMTDAEWAAKQQRVKTARERLRIEPVVNAPAAG